MAASICIDGCRRRCRPTEAPLLDQVGSDNVTVINLRGGKHWMPLDQLAERLWKATGGNLDTEG
ncbi:MAG: hypothetical protein CL575_03815 [Altererythrobacter sp.]|nr:hypothetical protein [Altererythrobacter sp.]MBK62061.1 hypothetical protein [Altererythrobacter sp.]|tara:strand:- start:1883 stop:2074 length:192 start_codon:yes stop_codon:yes gene_type:complete